MEYGGFTDRFDVDVTELTRAADVARAAADRAVGINFTDPLTTAASSMDGAQAAAALNRVGERWQELCQRWSGLVLQFAVELESARTRYETSDSQADREATDIGNLL